MARKKKRKSKAKSEPKKLTFSEENAHLAKLPEKQRAFVQYLLTSKDFNFAEAAREAGYTGSHGSKLIQNEDIRKILGTEIRKRAERRQITADRVLEEIAKIGFANVKDIVNDDGTVKPLSSIPDHASAAIQNIRVTTASKDGAAITRVEVEYYDKMEALTLLMDHLGMSDPDIDGVETSATTEGLLMDLITAVEENTNVIDSTSIDVMAKNG